MRRSIIFWGPAAALLVGACGQVEPASGGPANTPSTSVSAPTFEVEKESADGLVGSFRHDGAVVAFSATSTDDGGVTARIKLDQRVMTASRNRSTQQASWSGGGSVLTPKDRTVLLSLATAFRDRWGPAVGGQPSGSADHRDLLLRLATLLAEAPLGVPLGDQ